MEAEEQELFANTIYEEPVALAILYRQMGTDLQLLLRSKHSHLSLMYATSVLTLKGVSFYLFLKAEKTATSATFFSSC